MTAETNNGVYGFIICIVLTHPTLYEKTKRQDGGVLLFSAAAIASLKSFGVTSKFSSSLSQTVTAQRTPPSACPTEYESATLKSSTNNPLVTITKYGTLL
ncbi:MAG: hypothetical protein HC874_32080 [Richelia sp. SL_2_1]|nr:hypothetical protein [Richelia sp. SM1_7_0]NJN13806.1 hypothetical protein [Richelia sp. RM1_1_1]NJO31674.1 hypothetical protein [Richelia sp. SL_2_1]